MQKTVIVIWKETSLGQNLVMNGGKASCAVGDMSPDCSIPISLRNADETKWPEYVALKDSNTELKWRTNDARNK